MSHWPFEPLVRDIVGLLVRGEYGRLEALSHGQRLTAEELAEAVREYPARLVLPPSGQEPPLDVVEVLGCCPRRWSVDVPLWTVKEGRSDLTLELSIIEGPPGEYLVEVDNLHVL